MCVIIQFSTGIYAMNEAFPRDSLIRLEDMDTLKTDELARTIYQDMHATFRQHPQYNEDVVKTLAAHIAGTVTASRATIPSHTIKSPSKDQQSCYQACADAKEKTLAEAAKLGFPLGIPVAASAVFAFNACRHMCDHTKTEKAGGHS